MISFKLWFFFAICAMYSTSAIILQHGSSLFLSGLWKKEEKEESIDNRQPVLVLDIDGTLYEDDCKVESQIRDLIFDFANETLSVSPEEMQSMYKLHHSNLKGLLQVANFSADNETELHAKADFLRKFYHDCYHNLDLSNLSRYQPTTQSSSMLTGYHNNHNFAAALQALRSIPYPIVIASNSPSTHAQRILSRLGLGDLPVAMFLTPDTLHDTSAGYVKTDAQFWDKLFGIFPPSQYICTLVDDRSLNLKTVSKLGMNTLLVGKNGQTLPEALAAFIANPYHPQMISVDDVEYLVAKNSVDKVAINATVKQSLAKELSSLLTNQDTDTLSMLDLGAGLCPLLFDLLQIVASSLPSVKVVRYTAVEGNINLRSAIGKRFQQLGLQPDPTTATDNKNNILTATGRIRGINVEAKVVFADFMQATAIVQEQVTARGKQRYDLIAGMGLADLFSATALLGRIRDFCHENSLVYLPIVFDGRTRLAYPHDDNRKMTAGTIDESEDVFLTYHQSLVRRGHHLHNPTAISDLLPAFGMELVLSGSSPWHVSCVTSPYLFKALLWFVQCGVGIERPDLDLRQWYKVLLEDKHEAKLVIENVDILARIKPMKTGNDLSINVNTFPKKRRRNSMTKATTTTRSVVEFAAPYTMQVKEEVLPPLKEDEFLLDTTVTMVSAGTELKAFRGQLTNDNDDNEPLDVNIKALERSSKIAYPLRYGYSLVGQVIATHLTLPGSEEDGIKVGQRMFAFAPHATATVLSTKNTGGYMTIPDDIHSEDAVFLPAIETALSLVMSASPLPGEHVLVAGQGLIGLLVAAVVRTTMPTVKLTVADVSEARLNLAKAFLDGLLAVQDGENAISMNDIVYWNPSSAAATTAAALEGFDAAIEVTGRIVGLQLAVDHARYGGRVIAGSWYDPKDSKHLSLGTKFHRGNVQIISAQVSRIAGKFSDRWTKQRRFEACWPLIRKIKPSRLVSGEIDICTAKEVQNAFEKLNRGDLITVLMKNSKRINLEQEPASEHAQSEGQRVTIS